MTTPKFHPLTRLFWCGVGLLLISTLLGGVLLLGNFLSTAFTDAPPRESFEEMVARFALPITLLTYPACLLWLGFCRQKWDRASFLSLGLRPVQTGKNLLSGALCGFLAIGVLWVILWLTGAVEVSGYSPQAFEMGALSLLPLAGYFAAFCAVACFEEILFRGYILHNLHAWLGWRWAVVGQAALFAVVHLGNAFTSKSEQMASALWALPALFLIGVFFAISVRKTGGLWFAIAFHALWNFSLGCLFSLPVSGIETFRLLDVEATSNSLASGGSFGAEASLYLPLLLIAMIWFLKDAANHPQTELDLALLARRDGPTLPVPDEEESEEEARENRFKTKFGTQTGFDSQTLRELRELQRAREAEAQKKPAQTVIETLVAAPVLSPNAVSTEVLASDTKVEAPNARVDAREPRVEMPEPRVEMPNTKVETPELRVEASEPRVDVPEPKVEALEPKVEASVPPKKKPSPKW